MNKRKIPASYPQLTSDDVDILHQVADKKWYTEGTYCKKFIMELCKVFGSKHAVLTNSGSSASLVALTVMLDFFRGLYVLVNVSEFPTTVAAVYHNNKIPIYIDIDPETLSPNMGQIAYALDRYGDDIAGAIFSHFLGFPYNEPLVREMLGDARFLVVDACDALGAKIDGKPVGSWSDASICSFFPAHHVFAIEGGSITTNDDKYIRRMLKYINWGRDCYCLPGQSGVCGKRFDQECLSLPEGWDHKYTFTHLGYNLKSDEFRGALGYSQMQRLDEIVDKRVHNYVELYFALVEFDEYVGIMSSRDLVGMMPSPFGLPLILKDKYKTLTNSLIQHLEENGISTRRFFGGNLMRQPGFKKQQYIALPDYDGANKLMEQGFWIGCHPMITQDDITYIAEKFKEFFDERKLF
jgi:CDP-6-deoxy-D-xylo-4-hexulose-3-dehydrase